MSPSGNGPSASHDFEADILAIESIAAVPTILDVVCRISGLGFAAVARVTEDRWVACHVKDNIAFGLQPGDELNVATTICKEIRQSGKAVVISHVAEDQAYCGHPTPAMYGFQSYISMPIVLPDGTFFGTLCAIDPKPALLDRPEIVGTFKMFADLIAFHLDAHIRLAASEALARSRDASTTALEALNSALTERAEARTQERDRIWQVSHDMLGVADTNGVWLSINPAWTTILGWHEEEVVGRTSAWLEHPDDHEKTRAEVARLAAGHSTLAFENRFRTRDGSYRTLSWRAVPVEGRLYCVARDVTEQRERAVLLEKAEEALRQSQKLEAVGQLTGGVAHDFNNLLTIIRSSVDFLRRPDLSEERRARYMEAVSDTVDRAARLTSQLLAFARRQTLKPEVFEVRLVLREMADMLDTVTGSRIRIVTALPDEPCFVRADLSQFETALVNMAVNARDAMNGEGTLTLQLICSSVLPLIRGHAGASGPFAAVSLTDTGSGIPPELIARVFEPFFTTKEVGRGTGLGLSQVFGFAKQSGGDIDVESRLGQGTTFTLYLPEVAPQPAQDPVSRFEHEAFPLGSGQCVLVVEDNIEVGRFATQILEDLGYRTTWVVNAEEALERLGSDGSGFDVVFSDVVMPGMGGLEMAKLLQRRLPALPVVLTSGYSHVLAQEGVTKFELLHKPYSADQLGRTLSHIIRQRLPD